MATGVQTGFTWNRPGKVDPIPTLTQDFASCTGTLPRTTPNSFDSNAQASKSLMHTPILRRNGFTHTQSGSIPMNTRISLATRGTTTDSLALFSVRMEPIIMGRQLVEGKAKHLQEQKVMGPHLVERSAEAPQTTNHGSGNHGCPTPPKCKFSLERTSPVPTSKKKMTMTPRKMVPTMVVPQMMAARTICTPHRGSRLRRPATIRFVDQNRCGSHII